MMLIFAISLLIISNLLYLYLKKRLNYWNCRGIPYVASDVYTALKTQFHNPVPFFNHYKKIYEQLPNTEYGGCFMHFKPQFVIREPELIKRILSKDFEHFHDRGSVIHDKYDPITNHIFSAPGDLWRALRVRFTPTFTSSKMKFMFNIVQECAEEYRLTLEKPASHNIPLDFKEKSAGYTIEVISSSAFGLKTNSIRNPKSEFRKIGSLIFKIGLRNKLQRILHEWFPFLKPFIRIGWIDRRVVQFFLNVVHDTVHYRKQSGSMRNDFLQILIALKEEHETKDKLDRTKTNTLKMTNELMTAQCFLFFVAGFDTSSLVLSMTLLELAIKPEIQKKLQHEIDESLEKYDSKITYEMIKNMSYLHKVVQETMRKYPVLSFLSRICTKTYTIPGTNLTIEKGTEVIIPLSGIHRDHKYYPNPEEYDPERFSSEEIQKRHNFIYLPFGEGPRNCIGSRFGLMSVKLGIVHLLQHYNFYTTPSTIYPVKFQPNKTVTSCEHEVLLRCKSRNIS